MEISDIVALITWFLCLFGLVIALILDIYVTLLTLEKKKEYLKQLDNKDKLLILEYEEYKKVHFKDFRKKKDNEDK